MADGSSSESTPICKQFLLGKCSRSRCKYLHDASANKQEESAPGGGKTSVCRDYMRGSCARGAECKFSHSDTSKVSTDYSKRVCRAFKKGECKFGSGCLYAHAEKEAIICKAFQVGRCEHGALCKFLHAKDITRRSLKDPASKSEKICFAFRNGSCKFGTSCKFAHVDRESLTALKKDKRKRCFPFQKGECRRGDLCKFQHILGSASNFVGKCFEWQQKGTCTKGDKCNFEHTSESDDSSETPTTTTTKIQYCYRFKKKGFCVKGGQCEFAHIQPEAKKITASDEVSSLRSKWKLLKDSNAEKSVVKEAKRRYKAAKESAARNISDGAKRSNDVRIDEPVPGNDEEPAKKKPKLSKKERSRRAYIIRSRGIHMR